MNDRISRALGALAFRLRLSGWALVLFPLAVAAPLPLATLTLAGLPLTVVTLGAGLFAVAVWVTRRLADLQRWVSTATLDVPVPRPYRPVPAGRVTRRFGAVVRDPATWRDLAWLLVHAVLGFATYTLVVVLLAGGVLWHAVHAVVWWTASASAAADPSALEEIVRVQYGAWVLDGPETAWVALLLSAGYALLWWLVTPPLMRGYAHLSRLLLAPTGTAALAARVAELTESRAETVDAQAAELRRIERDLHDGAQARLVSLGMSLGMAEELVRTDPETAARLVAEAQHDSRQALSELRELVRGMHPPVLADRGLVGAVQALAESHPLPVEADADLPGRPPAPVESAVYFAVSELLTNVTKHAHADSVQVRIGYAEQVLQVTVVDDGRGGAVLADSGGLRGVRRRLSAFDGALRVDSPAGGPTTVTMEIQCELSWEKTTHSCATG